MSRQIALIHANLFVGGGSLQPESAVVVDEGDPTADIAPLTEPERNLDMVLCGGRFVKNSLEHGSNSNFQQ